MVRPFLLNSLNGEEHERLPSQRTFSHYPQAMEDDDNSHLSFESADAARKRVAQAKALKDQAATGGLEFRVFLPSGLAEWVLNLVEQGVFLDPSEAVFVLMQQAKELEPHDDLKEEILRRTLDSRSSGPYITLEELKTRLSEDLKERAPPAVWNKITSDESSAP